MKEIHVFNEQTDLCPTVPGLAINMASALETGIVVDTGTLGTFNDIDEPSSIWKRVGDTFEALEAMKLIDRHGRKVVSSQKGNGDSYVNPVKQGESE